MAGDELIGHDDVLHYRELELGLHGLPIEAEDGPSSRFGTTANPHARRLRPTQAGLRSSSWRRSKITLTKGSSERVARSFRWISSWSLATTTSHRGVNLSKIRGCAYTQVLLRARRPASNSTTSSDRPRRFSARPPTPVRRDTKSVNSRDTGSMSRARPPAFSSPNEVRSTGPNARR